MQLRSLSSALIATVLVLSAAPAALARQDQQPAKTWEFRVGTGLSHQFDGDIDSGGEFNVTRVHGEFGATYTFNPDLKIDLSFGYEYSGYDFSGSSGFGALDPWEDIHSLRLRALLTARIDDQWSVFGGPVITLAGEDADFDDGVSGGGLIGASYRVSDTLTLGGGIALISELEDDVAVFPVFVVNWNFAQDWTLRNSQATLGLGQGGGLEVAWEFADDWELGLGVQYQWRQFRLDDTGTAPNGVGEELSIPLYANATWQISPTAQLSMFAAVAVGGEIEVQDSSGSTISDQDYDPAGLLGARFTLRF